MKPQREPVSVSAKNARLLLQRLEDQGAAQLLMGIAYYSQKKPEQATRWFKRAKKNPKTRDDATNWLNYLEREQRSS